MAKRRYRKNDPENASIEALDKLKLLDEYLPAVEEFVRKGGTVESFLNKSRPVAYARLASLLLSKKEDTAHKAAVELLNRADGKPTERKMVLHGDVGELNERQLDAEIMKAFKKDPGLAKELAQNLLPQTTQALEKPEESKKTTKRRRARVAELIEEES